jgi:hypothetical protein
MNIRERIEAFAELGKILRDSLAQSGNKDSEMLNLIKKQHIINPWFTPENVSASINAIAGELTVENLETWTNNYPQLKSENRSLRAGIIMAGNIPLVGFHDFLSVLISGNHLIAKTSSRDSELIVKITEILCGIEPRFQGSIEFTEGQLKDFDVIIATGSNNSSRYFEHYFGRYPNIIRKNRNSIAVIGGNETDAELEDLATDIFLYFGLGCRNVSKIFIPEKYDLKSLTARWDQYSGIISHEKYANNYDFSKAVFIVNKENFLDTGYLLLKEEKGVSSPVAVLYYEYYKSVPGLMKDIKAQEDKIQCIVGHGHVPFGRAQSPHLWDYADGIDTIDFLSKKNYAGIL